MPVTLPLDEMTVEEKLDALELIWHSLSKNPEDIPLPDWHLEALMQREQLIKDGEAHFLDWEDAKKESTQAISKTL
jgi:hypothetical protein